MGLSFLIALKIKNNPYESFLIFLKVLRSSKKCIITYSVEKNLS